MPNVCKVSCLVSGTVNKQSLSGQKIYNVHVAGSYWAPEHSLSTTLESSKHHWMLNPSAIALCGEKTDLPILVANITRKSPQPPEPHQKSPSILISKKWVKRESHHQIKVLEMSPWKRFCCYMVGLN